MQSNQNLAEITAPVVALDVGGTFVKAGLIDAAGNCCELLAQPTDANGSAEHIVAALAEIIALSLRRDASVAGVGVSIPGPFDYARGVSLMTHKFASLNGIDLVAALRRQLPKLAAVPIRFRHDANSFLAGEMWRGSARGFSRAGGITLGTGLGAAFCRDGQFLTNDLGSPAPEVSLWNKPYRDGIVEDYVSARALVKKYCELRTDYDPIGGVKNIADDAHNGEAAARRLFLEFGEDLAAVLTPWCKCHRPDAIVFGGQISKVFALFSPPLRQLAQSVVLHPGSLDTTAALYGAAAIFLNR